MELKTIRNVDEETWRMFKMLSARAGVGMGTLLRIMVTEFEKNNKKFWSSLLNQKRILSDEEARDIININEGLRKERGFRDESSI